MAYKIGYDIVLKDSEIESAKNYCDKKSKEIELKIEMFVSILDDILIEGVQSGEFHDKIEIFKGKVEGLQGEVEDVTRSIKSQLNKFFYDFDDADSCLY